MKLAKKFVLAGLLGALVTGAWVAWRFYLTANFRVPEAYAAWTTADLIIDHLEANSGEWPSGWQDLRRAADTRIQEGRPLRWEFAELPELVSVDWFADPEILGRVTPHSEEPPFHVVRRKDGSDFSVVWQGAEPNQMILDFLTGRPR